MPQTMVVAPPERMKDLVHELARAERVRGGEAAALVISDQKGSLNYAVAQYMMR